MIYVSEGHSQRFTRLFNVSENLSSAYIAAIYLLTAYDDIWQSAKSGINTKKIDFINMELHGMRPGAYTLYVAAKDEYISYSDDGKQLYTKKTLQEICLGLYSMCKGAEAVYFNGHTNISDDMFICFGVKGLMDTNQRLKDAMLFNILSYMSNELLDRGNTAASIDELYLCEATRCRI